jgi:hypothetical protein
MNVVDKREAGDRFCRFPAKLHAGNSINMKVQIWSSGACEAIYEGHRFMKVIEEHANLQSLFLGRR